MAFDGFPAETLKFLRALQKNNTKAWFEANRASYEAGIKVPAKAFGAAMAAELERLTHIEHSTKMFRINRDLRFSKDKTPYNAHLHVSFAPRGDLAAVVGWSFGLARKYLTIGVGMMSCEAQNLSAYRQRVDSRAGAALAQRIDAVLNAGARLGGEPELKRVPKEYPTDHPRGELLRRKSLTLWMDFPGPKSATNPTLLTDCVAGYKQLLPVYDWLSALRK